MSQRSEAVAKDTSPKVDLKIVSADTLTAALKEAGLSCDGSLVDLVGRLADHDAKVIGGDKTKGGACDKCGGISLLSRKVCPYCGTGDEQPAADPPAAKPAPRSRKEVAEAKAAKTKPNEGKKAPKAEPAKANQRTGTAVANKDAKANSNLPQPESTPVTLSKPEVTKVTAAHVKKLDRATEQCRKILSDVVGNYWQLGRQIAEIHKNSLYKFRLDEAQQTVHRSFNDYCKRELGIGPQYARDLMGMSEAFTEDEVRKVGPTKLRYIDRLPEERRQPLLEAAPLMSVSEVKAEVHAVKPPEPRKVRGAKPPPKPTRAVAPNEATAVIVPRGPEPLHFIAEEGQPGFHAVIEQQNAMQLHLHITVNADGSLVGTYEFKRVVEAE